MEQIKTICEQLQATNSKKKKERILEQNKNNQLFKEILKFNFDPFILSGLSDKKINKCTNIKANTEFDTINEMFDYLKANNTGKDIDIANIQTYIRNQPIEIQTFITEIITKALKLGCDSKTINKVYGKNFIPTWEVQQSYSIEKHKLKPNEWFSLSEKLNGIRGSYINGKIVSRQGKEICGLDHIIKDIKSLNINEFFIDGELVRKNLDGLSDNENFRIGTGILNSDISEKPEICFVVFDIFDLSEFLNGKSKETYKARRKVLNRLRAYIEFQEIKNIKIVNTYYEGYDQNEINRWLDIMVKEDKEGLILNRNTIYKCKRHSGILKIKRFYTMDLPVIGYEEGTGRLKGILGALIVDFKGNSINVGSGYTDEQRYELWQKRDNLIGRVIEVKYKEISKNKNSTESLQFPIFIRLREEGKEVSYS